MLSLLSAVLICLGPKSPVYNQVWIGPNDEILTISEVGEGQMMLGERHIFVPTLTEVPNGDLVGYWTGARRLFVTGADYRRGTKTLDPETEADRGEIRITQGPQDAYGRISSIAVNIYDGNGSSKVSGSFFKCTDLENLGVIGSFTSEHLKFEIAEEKKPERGTSGFGQDTVAQPVFTGTVSYNGDSYLIKGRRARARGAFEVVDLKYGNIKGEGYFEWYPTPSRARKLMDRDAKETDRIIVFVRLEGLPSGTELVLTRAKK